MAELESSSDSDSHVKREVLTSNTFKNQYQFVYGSSRITGKKSTPDDWNPPPEGSGKDFNPRNAKKKLRRHRASKEKIRRKGDEDLPIGVHTKDRVGDPGPRVDSDSQNPVDPDLDGLNGYPLVIPDEISSKDPRTVAALKKIHMKLSNEAELLKLHLKHHHMNPTNFKHRTSKLQIPKEIYDKYETIWKSCPSCQKFQHAPERSRVSGMRAEKFGDLWFIDHVDITIQDYLENGNKETRIYVVDCP